MLGMYKASEFISLFFVYPIPNLYVTGVENGFSSSVNLNVTLLLLEAIPAGRTGVSNNGLPEIFSFSVNTALPAALAAIPNPWHIGIASLAVPTHAPVFSTI